MFQSQAQFLLEMLQDDALFSIAIILVLTIGITAAFARTKTLAFFWSLLKAYGQYLISPFLFIAKYVAFTHAREEGEPLLWIKKQAPLTRASLTFVSSFTAFSGIVILATTVFVAGQALFPSAHIGETLKLLEIRLVVEKQEQDHAQAISAEIRNIEDKEMPERLKLLEKQRDIRIADLRAQQGKFKNIIDVDQSAKGELERLQLLMPIIPNNTTLGNIKSLYGSPEEFTYKIKDRYYIGCISKYLECTNRIRILQYNWDTDYPYKELLSKEKEFSDRGNSYGLQKQISELEPLNHLRWKEMARTLMLGLIFFWGYVWIFGFIVEFLNLLLGHFEWVKQLQGMKTRHMQKSEVLVPDPNHQQPQHPEGGTEGDSLA